MQEIVRQKGHSMYTNMSAVSENISAVYLQNCSYENDLNVLLSPPDELRGNYELLAGGYLNFKLDEVNYIKQKNYPFVYLLDSWIKRVGAETATMQHLHKSLIEMERPDAAEIVMNAMQDLGTKSPEELRAIADKHNQKLKRSESNASLCPYVSAKSIIVQDIPVKNSSTKQHKDSVNKGKEFSFKKPSFISKNKQKEDGPSVYLVNLTDEVEHEKLVVKMIQKLQKKYGVTVKNELFENSEYSESEGYYIYSNLIEAEYVLYVCTPSGTTDGEETEETRKKKDFIHKLILDFIFENGSKSKYVPILLPGCQRSDIPQFLRGISALNMLQNEFYDDLYRRLFKIEKYVLGDLPAKRPQLKPIDIGQLIEKGVL